MSSAAADERDQLDLVALVQHGLGMTGLGDERLIDLGGAWGVGQSSGVYQVRDRGAGFDISLLTVDDDPHAAL